MTVNKIKELFESVHCITLLGYYGAYNFGDDLMMESITDELLTYDKSINLITYSKPVAYERYNKIYYFWKDNGRLNNLSNFSKIVHDSDLIVWGGGTCFTDEDGDGFFIYMLYAKLVLRKKIAYMGVGIGKLKKLKSNVKLYILLNICDYISLRDPYSYVITKRIKKHKYTCIDLVEDYALYTVRKYKFYNSTRNNEQQLLISWRNLHSYDSQPSLESLMCYIFNLIMKYNIKKVVLIDADSSLDEDINEIIYQHLLEKCKLINIYYDHTKIYSEKLIRIVESNYIITSRLHIAVAGNEFKDKIIYVYNYSPKINYFVSETANDNMFLFDKKTLENVNKGSI